MSIHKVIAAATVALALASGAALAGPSIFPQTPAQMAADLSNPNNTTYVPLHK